MKKIIVIIITILSLASCAERDGHSLAAELTSFHWTQTSEPIGSNTGSLSVEYTIKNTGKEDIIGFSITFHYSTGSITSIVKLNDNLSRKKPNVLPANEQNLDKPILPGEIYVHTEEYKLEEGTNITKVEVTRLHVWSEWKDRIYTY